MRLLMFSWEYPPVIEGGLGRHVRKLAERLAADGVEVHVITRGGSNLDQHEIRAGVVIHRVSEPPFPSDTAAFIDWVSHMNGDMARLAATLTKEIDFDLVHSHDWLVAGAAEQTARGAELKWLVTVHATEFGRHQGWVRQPPQSQIHSAERGMVRRADHVITCSEYMRDHACEVYGVARDHITAIPNGIDQADLEPVQATAELERLRAAYASPDQLLVLMVGRLVYEKGFHLALEAIAPLVAAGLPVRYVVAGTGTAESDLRSQARTLGLEASGEFLGWITDETLDALYAVADIAIVPSIYEPFGIVALEAMAAGCVCLVADTGGLREVVPADRSVGLRFHAGDAGALRDCLEDVLSNAELRRRLTDAAHQHIVQFDWNEVAERTRAIYDSLAAREPVAN
jgi:glycogen(starch) synthase